MPVPKRGSDNRKKKGLFPAEDITGHCTDLHAFVAFLVKESAWLAYYKTPRKGFLGERALGRWWSQARRHAGTQARRERRRERERDRAGERERARERERERWRSCVCVCVCVCMWRERSGVTCLGAAESFTYRH